MGKLEEKNRKRAKKENLQRLVLYSVAAAGVIGVAAVVPNVLGAMKRLGLLPKPRQKEYVASSASKLAKRGLLKFKNGYYQLTQKGEQILRRWQISEYRFKKPKKWDKRWRMIIFDIPEIKKRVRKQISSLFEEAGFYRLQDSVWVYPYDCEDIIGLLKTDFGVGREVLYVIASEIENDKHLRQEFGLLP